MTSKQVLILRKDLNMRKGKCVSQGAHGSMRAILNLGVFDEATKSYAMDFKAHPFVWSWLFSNYKKITVYVNSEAELLELHQKALALNLPCDLVQDSGLTEFGGVPTYTCVAIGPGDETVIDPITGHLPLF